MKSIAYYLPQFHTIPENDEWWGKGFTEWSNVRTAEAMYEGHYQPKEPLDYYDLSEINVMKKQVCLAKKYGLYGFCFHYYWFQGKRLLEKPINNFLKNKSSDLDFPFMLCWANENWTRRWDGKENEVLISQNHSEEDYWKVAEDIFKYIDDDRYIKINNKPLLIIYRPEIMTKFNYFVKVLRLKAFERGFEGIEILSTNSFGFKNKDCFDIDGIVEFPPHFPSGDFVKKSTDINTRSDFKGLIYDYKHCVKKSINYYNEKQMAPKSIDYYPCSFPSWDNTARRGVDSHICANTSKKLFKKWLRGCCDFSKQYNPKEKDFIFINAWNEWAEGAILEPDKKNGLSSLKALKSVMKEYGNSDARAESKNTKKQERNDIVTINKKYDICFCCDENLIEYAINPINAISEKNVNNNLIIHFIYSGKEGDLDHIENALVDRSNIIFKKYIVDSLDIHVDKTWRSIDHLSSATNLKLQIPEILSDIDRVTYFDIDTIPYVNLVEFDSVQTDICGIAMRQEIKNGWRTFNGSAGTATENKNPVDFGDRVIGNSGVMVLDLNELRKRKFTDLCIQEKQRNTYNIALTGGDQDLINIFCRCHFNELPDKLNILVSDQLIGIDGGKFKFKKFIRSNNQGLHLLKNKGEEHCDGGVLHFIGKDKPWNSDCPGSDFWQKFSINKKQSINFHKDNPGKIVDYFDIDCQLTNKNLSNIVKEIQEKKCRCNMLVFGLGKDSIIYDTVNKGYTLFVETNQAWIDLNKDIKNKILYDFTTTVKDSLPINKEYLNRFEIPDFIKKTKWDIILVDAPPGDRLEAPGRALPIYWSSQVAKRHKVTVFIDDCRRDLEKEYCDKFFAQIGFNMKSDIERGEFRMYKQKKSEEKLVFKK